MSKWPENILLGWAMPLTWQYINNRTHLSILAMEKPNLIYLEAPDHGDIADKREEQIAVGLREGCTHIFVCDADMVYHPLVLRRLFALFDSGADLAGGLIYRGYRPYEPVMWDKDNPDKRLQFFVDYRPGPPLEVGGTGCACLLIKREVFEKLERPWFVMGEEIEVRQNVKIIRKRGEDAYFTKRAVKEGFKLMIDTEFDIPHIREFQIDRHFYLLHAIVERLGSWENVLKLFKKLQNKAWIEENIIT